MPRKRKKILSEVAHVRRGTFRVLKAASVELARILARIGYVCEGNAPINLSFMDSIFSMTCNDIFLEIYTM